MGESARIIRYHACTPYYVKNIVTPMIEINPITNQIKDLRERAEALRGYL